MNIPQGSTAEQFQYRRLQEELNYTRIIPQQPSFLIQSPVDGIIAAQVIKKHFSRLLEVEPIWLANRLFSKDLLSQPNLKKIIDSPGNLSLALLESSEIIKSDGEAFNDFLLILHDELAYRRLVTSLKTEYGEYYNY